MTISTHSGQLERWLGTPETELLSRNFRNWYGPPVAVAGVPGNVRVTGGGDFIGPCAAGYEISGWEAALATFNRAYRRRVFGRISDKQRGSFSSLSALITAATTAGKQCRMNFSKVGTAPTAILGAIDLFGVGNQPALGVVGAAAPGGTVPTNATTGCLPFVNAVSNANTSHFVNAYVSANFVNSLLLCDRLLSVLIAPSSLATQAVTGAITRYNSSSNSSASYCGGNFAYPAAYGTLGAVAHNWTVCQYTPPAGSGTSSFPSMAGINACAANQIDLLLGNWFLPLASGDAGVYNLTQMQCSVNTVTGSMNFVVSHPIAVFPIPLVNIAQNIDGVASAFNLVTVFDNACLYFIELPKPATNATTYSGIVATVSE